MTGKLFRIATTTIVFAVAAWQQGIAQDDGLLSPFEPSLGLAIPLKQGNEQVLVVEKFLLNNNVIIQQGDIIRVVFPRPEANDKDVRRKDAAKRLEGTFSRQPSKIPTIEDTDTKSSVIRAAMERAVKNYWKNEMLFRGYIDRMDLDNNILVFEHPGAENLIVELFSFPRDLFLGEDNGKVTILAVRKDSQPQALGLKAGDILTEMNGKPLTSLENFRDRYFPEKQSLEQQNQPMTFSVIPKGETEAKLVTFKLARSLTDNPLMMDLPDPNAKPQTSGTAPAAKP